MIDFNPEHFPEKRKEIFPDALYDIDRVIHHFEGILTEVNVSSYITFEELSGVDLNEVRSCLLDMQIALKKKSINSETVAIALARFEDILAYTAADIDFSILEGLEEKYIKEIRSIALQVSKDIRVLFQVSQEGASFFLQKGEERVGSRFASLSLVLSNRARQIQQIISHLEKK